MNHVVFGGFPNGKGKKITVRFYVDIFGISDKSNS